MVLEEPLLVDRLVPVLVKKDLVCFQIQEIVSHFSILLRPLWPHLVQQNGMNLSIWEPLSFWIEDWMKNFKELLMQGYLLLKYIHLLRYIILELQVNVQHQKVFEVHYLMELHRFHLIQHHLQFRLGLRPQFSLQVQHLRDCRALQEGCLMLEVLWHRQDFLWGILPGWQDLMGYLWMTQFLEFLLEVFLVRIQVQVIDLYQPKLRFHLHLHNKELEIQLHNCLWGRVQWFRWHKKWIEGLQDQELVIHHNRVDKVVHPEVERKWRWMRNGSHRCQ